MADKTSVVARFAAPGAASDTTLETSRLLVEFLHAAYATRRLDMDVEGNGDGAANGGTGHHGTESADVSSHAVRAAIHIYQHGERTVGQLATGLGISYGWASRVVEELEKAGYAIRERDADDRRVVRVRLNPDKSGEVERAYQWRGPTVAAALEPLAAPEREAVRIFLRRLNSLLREEEPGQH
jgi:DNA-binding MarR family transcriptional regulator